MSSKICVFQYKCRRCGIVTDGAITNEKCCVAYLIMVTMGHTPPGIPQHMNDIHHCADGSFGISDLIGADIRNDR